jgi:hypothetical protein
MQFKDKDLALQKKILEELQRRHTINANAETGTAYFQPEWEDKINPSVRITRDEIRAETQREKVRDSVMADYQKKLKVPGINVQLLDDDTLLVEVAPIRSRENNFPTLRALTGKNEMQLEADPTLGEPLF